MKFSYNWLQDFFSEPLPPAQEIAEQLGIHSFELEGVEEVAGGDVLIDWDILPNRSSDCLCYEGVAREISSVFDIPYKSYLEAVQSVTYDTTTKTSDVLQLEVPTSKVVRVTKRYAHNVRVAPSPAWLQTKLESIGQKSINNVVDITNYVMWVTGQPVHAFDYDKLAGGDTRKVMSIRHAVDGEEVTDLTGETHTLDSSMLVVADSEKALDVAGIKGGANSGVDDSTTRIVLSACNYDYKNIRQTSRALKLQTDASKRYENEVPVGKADSAMALLADLITRECGGVVSDEILNIQEDAQEVARIVCTVDEINALLGLTLTLREITAILDRLFIAHKTGDQEGSFIALPPDERLDLRIKQDITEEVGRIFGLYNIPETPIQEGFFIPKKNILKQSWYKTADLLAGLGFYEVYNRSLVATGDVKLANSLNAHADSLRNALLPELIKKNEKNFAHTDTPHFFEIGKVFTGVTDGVVDEHWSFAGVLGRRKIKDKQKNELFLQTKGVLESVLSMLHIDTVEWKPTTDAEALAVLEIAGEAIGHVGVNTWEINFQKLIDAQDLTVNYKKPSKYPKMDRDVAVFVPTHTTTQEVRDIIEKTGIEKCISIDLFDVFEDPEHDRKSFAFRLVFQCDDTTLSDEYANAEMEKVYAALTSHSGFEIR